MPMPQPKELVIDVLAKAGIRVNNENPRPWDITVHNPAIYDEIIRDGLLGAAESYVRGDWDSGALDQTLTRASQVDLERYLPGSVCLKFRIAASHLGLLIKESLPQRRSEEVFKVGKHHYDRGNGFYHDMLVGDRNDTETPMVYTCAYWENGATTLAEAQWAKTDLSARKVNLKPGDEGLDIGGGWGNFAEHAAEEYGAHTLNVTVSEKQVAGAEQRRRTKPEHIQRLWENRLSDYLDVRDGPFDFVTSFGFFEHVRPEHYVEHMNFVSRNLKDNNSIYLMHTIASLSEKQTGGTEWIRQRIFPNSQVPTLEQIAHAAKGRLVIEDVHNFGANYDPTLMAWFANLDKNWEGDKNSEDYRTWKLYLLASAGGFRSRQLQLYQIVFSKNGVPGGYHSVR